MTLFDLLSKGCTVIFPCGYILEGDPQEATITHKIKLAGEVHFETISMLDKDGVREAVQAQKHHEKRYKETG